MDSTDRKLLNLLQAGLPLVSRPFAQIAAQTALTESEAISRVKAMLSHVAQSPSAVIQNDAVCGAQPPSAAITPTIRKIGPILDSRALGYVSTLAAMSVPENKIDSIAEIVNAFPGVTHNYIREVGLTGQQDSRTTGQQDSGIQNSDIQKSRCPDVPISRCPNMWFTVHARSEAALAAVLHDIEKRSGCKVSRFDATKLFKIAVRFELDDTNGAQPPSAAIPSANVAQPPSAVIREIFSAIDAKDLSLLRATQDGLPVCAEPYAAVGAQIGMTGDEVIERLKRMLDIGVIRRIGASLSHRSAGFTANAMIAWQAPEARLEEIGNAFAQRKEVTHCYSRKTAPGWPFNLYTMVHGKSEDACAKIISSLSAASGLTDFLVLYSIRELKKTSFRI